MYTAELANSTLVEAFEGYGLKLWDRGDEVRREENLEILEKLRVEKEGFKIVEELDMIRLVLVK
jgi:hypothetical protein